MCTTLTDAELDAAFDSHADEALAVAHQTLPAAIEAWELLDNELSEIGEQ